VPVKGTASTEGAFLPLTDLTLATEPSTYSYSGDVSWDQSLQELVVAPLWWGYPAGKGIINLGESPGASKLSLRVVQSCGASGSGDARAALISSMGAFTEVPIACDRSTPPSEVLLPGTGPVWLLVDKANAAPYDRVYAVVRDLAFKP
jgi:hypothetical protein